MSSQKDASTFLRHLDALRGTLIRCFLAVVILYVPCYFLTPWCLQALIAWCCPPEIGSLKYFVPMEVFMTRLKLALALSVVVSFPYCLWHIWDFLLPALYENERKALKWWVGGSCSLFLLGALFCVAAILPLVMRFSYEFATDYLTPMIGLAGFLELAGTLIIVFGIAFQFPLAVVLGVRFGLVSTKTLKSKRRYIIVIILIVSGILTPPDVISQILMAIPTWMLFELGLMLAARYEKQFAAEREESRGEKNGQTATADEPPDPFYPMPAKAQAAVTPVQDNDDGMLDFYDRESRK